MYIHVLIRDEEGKKEERSKQGHINNKEKQYSTPKAVTFPKKNELPRVHVHVHVYMLLGTHLFDSCTCMYIHVHAPHYALCNSQTCTVLVHYYTITDLILSNSLQQYVLRFEISVDDLLSM